MSGFKTYHPIVNITYFIFVIGYGCLFLHPVCLGISLISGFTYSVVLKGTKAIRKSLIYMIPMMVAMALINPLFNHRGVTIIGYLPSGNPLTAESIVYGICASVMLASVICHFSCYNEVMTSDKFIYLFGRIIPAMSLIISMTLRFVPRFSSQLKLTLKAQRCIGRDVSNGSLLKRAKHGLSILSIMTTWCLENAIDTADSMKSRGYGLKGRTAFSVFTFEKRDKKALVCLLLLGLYTLLGKLTGELSFVFFPYIKGAEASAFGISVFFSYLILCMFPVIIDIWEVIRWKALKSKM